MREVYANAPQTSEILADLANLAMTQEMLNRGQIAGSRKMSHGQAYYRKEGRSSPRQKP